MFEVGDTIALNWEGQPGAASLTVTQPDGTALGPFTVTVGASYQFSPTIAGRHLARWATTTGTAQAYTDAFDVADVDPGFIISLADVKTQLNISSSSNDDELRMWLGATTDVVEHYVEDVVPRTYTETHDGGSFTIVTYHAPIITVTTLTEYIGLTAFPLTLQPYGSSVSPYGFTIDNPAGGVISRRSAASWPFQFQGGPGSVTVTYRAGRQQIPAAIQAAARIIVQHLWTTRRGTMPLPAQGGQTMVVPGLGYAVPNAAVDLLLGFQRQQGIA